jgi:hypothetical protein
MMRYIPVLLHVQVRMKYNNNNNFKVRREWGGGRLADMSCEEAMRLLFLLSTYFSLVIVER